jgi:hypothetical protein
MAYRSIRDAVGGKYAMSPSLNYVIATFSSDPAWSTLCPPRVELKEEQGKSLLSKA